MKLGQAMAIVAGRHGIDSRDDEAVLKWFSGLSEWMPREQAAEILYEIGDVEHSLEFDDPSSSPPAPMNTPLPPSDPNGQQNLEDEIRRIAGENRLADADRV